MLPLFVFIIFNYRCKSSHFHFTSRDFAIDLSSFSSTLQPGSTLYSSLCYCCPVDLKVISVSLPTVDAFSPFSSATSCHQPDVSSCFWSTEYFHFRLILLFLWDSDGTNTLSLPPLPFWVVFIFFALNRRKKKKKAQKGTSHYPPLW